MKHSVFFSTVSLLALTMTLVSCDKKAPRPVPLDKLNEDERIEIDFKLQCSLFEFSVSELSVQEKKWLVSRVKVEPSTTPDDLQYMKKYCKGKYDCAYPIKRNINTKYLCFSDFCKKHPLGHAFFNGIFAPEESFVVEQNYEAYLAYLATKNKTNRCAAIDQFLDARRRQIISGILNFDGDYYSGVPEFLSASLINDAQRTFRQAFRSGQECLHCEDENSERRRVEKAMARVESRMGHYQEDVHVTNYKEFLKRNKERNLLNQDDLKSQTPSGKRVKLNLPVDFSSLPDEQSVLDFMTEETVTITETETETAEKAKAILDRIPKNINLPTVPKDLSTVSAVPGGAGVVQGPAPSPQQASELWEKIDCERDINERLIQIIHSDDHHFYDLKIRTLKIAQRKCRALKEALKNGTLTKDALKKMYDSRAVDPAVRGLL